MSYTRRIATYSQFMESSPTNFLLQNSGKTISYEKKEIWGERITLPKTSGRLKGIQHNVV
jgi:hypothetical protein